MYAFSNDKVIIGINLMIFFLFRRAALKTDVDSLPDSLIGSEAIIYW